jgi:hypothetical protein
MAARGAQRFLVNRGHNRIHTKALTSNLDSVFIAVHHPGINSVLQYIPVLVHITT